jgi:hypothetical protein
MFLGNPLFTTDAGTVGHHQDGSPYSAPVDGTVFRNNGNGTYIWVREKDLADVFAMITTAGLSSRVQERVVNPDVFGVLIGERPHL